MFSIYPKSFDCLARNWAVILALGIVLPILLGYFAPRGANFGGNAVITTLMTAGMLRFFLLDEPLTKGAERGVYLRVFGALLLVGATPLVFLGLAFSMVLMQGGAPSVGNVVLLILAVLGLPLWIAMTAMALPAAALKQPVLAHAFGDIRKTFLPTLGGLIIGPVLVLGLGILLLGGMVYSMARTGDISAFGTGSVRLWLMAGLSLALQILAQTLSMAALAHVWQTRVKPASQAEVFA